MEWNPQTYAAHCGHVTEHGKNLVELLQNQGFERVLDLGCGTGALTRELQRFVPEVVGADASPGMIEKARASYPGIAFQVADGRSLPWQSYFDAVFSNAVFHFILDQDALLQSVHRALRPGGALICEFGAAGNIAGLLAAMERACLSRGKPYHLLTRGNRPASGKQRRWTSFSDLPGVSPAASCGLASPSFCWLAGFPKFFGRERVLWQGSRGSWAGAQQRRLTQPVCLFAPKNPTGPC